MTDKERQMLDGIMSEIGAGMVMFPMTDVEHAHNNACERAKSIIANYRDGHGLFQLTAKLAKKAK